MSRDKRNMKGEQEDKMNRKTRGTGRQEEYERQEEQEDKRNRKTRGTGRQEDQEDKRNRKTRGTERQEEQEDMRNRKDKRNRKGLRNRKLACLLGAQLGSEHEKNEGRKSRDTLPLIRIWRRI